MNDDFDKKLNSDAKLLRELEKIPVFLNAWEKREDEDGNEWDDDAIGVLNIISEAEIKELPIPRTLAKMLFAQLGYDFDGDFNLDYNDDGYGVYLPSDKLNAMLKPLVKDDDEEITRQMNSSLELQARIHNNPTNQEIAEVDISSYDSQDIIRNFLIEIKKRGVPMPYEILSYLYELADGNLSEIYWQQIKPLVVRSGRHGTGVPMSMVLNDSVSEKLPCDAGDFVKHILVKIKKDNIQISYAMLKILYTLGAEKVEGIYWHQFESDMQSWTMEMLLAKKQREIGMKFIDEQRGDFIFKIQVADLSVITQFEASKERAIIDAKSFIKSLRWTRDREERTGISEGDRRRLYLDTIPLLKHLVEYNKLEKTVIFSFNECELLLLLHDMVNRIGNFEFEEWEDEDEAKENYNYEGLVRMSGEIARVLDKYVSTIIFPGTKNPRRSFLDDAVALRNVLLADSDRCLKYETRGYRFHRDDLLKEEVLIHESQGFCRWDGYIENDETRENLQYYLWNYTGRKELSENCVAFYVEDRGEIMFLHKQYPVGVYFKPVGFLLAQKQPDLIKIYFNGLKNPQPSY